mgnify:CR=1 FL=1
MTHPRSNPADASAQNISVFPSRHLQLPQASLLPPPTIKQQSQHKKQNLTSVSPSQNEPSQPPLRPILARAAKARPATTSIPIPNHTSIPAPIPIQFPNSIPIPAQRRNQPPPPRPRLPTRARTPPKHNPLRQDPPPPLQRRSNNTGITAFPACTAEYAAYATAFPRTEGFSW